MGDGKHKSGDLSSKFQETCVPRILEGLHGRVPDSTLASLGYALGSGDSLSLPELQQIKGGLDKLHPNKEGLTQECINEAKQEVRRLPVDLKGPK